MPDEKTPTKSATTAAVKTICQIGNAECPMDRYVKLTVEYYPHKKTEQFEDGEWVFEVGLQGYGAERIPPSIARTFEEALSGMRENAAKHRVEQLGLRRQQIKDELERLTAIESELTQLESRHAE